MEKKERVSVSVHGGVDGKLEKKVPEETKRLDNGLDLPIDGKTPEEKKPVNVPMNGGVGGARGVKKKD